MIFAIGLFCIVVDYPSSKEKKLKMEALICKYMGIAYIVGSFGLYVLFRIF
ncbi:MAG: CLC_0170 family protein [Thermotaleaceae bacterium]